MDEATTGTLLQELEGLCDGPVVTYITGDRPLISAQIHDDAVRPMYRHLQKLSEIQRKRLNLFIYSRGGDVSVPWRIVSMVRELFDEVRLLVPYKAHSAATLIALGVDRVVMGPKAELSPIDPTLTQLSIAHESAPPSQIAVEDVTSYIQFVRERANINDQDALSRLVAQLVEHITPLALGGVYRSYSHIRLVARKLLTSTKTILDEQRIVSIVEALTEKLFSHGHAIGRTEAKELGLPVENPAPDVERLMWRLFESYESYLQLDQPVDPVRIMENTNEDTLRETQVPVAVIESRFGRDVFELNFVVQRTRRIPANPNVNIPIQLTLPPDIDAQSLPSNLQQIVQQILQHLSQNVAEVVKAEITRQSPVVGVNFQIYGGRWVSHWRTEGESDER
jgi:hypothetical protein